jgi:hypothetical protein
VSEDVQADAVADYEEALERARLVKSSWVELGRPVMAEGGATGRAPVMHPLLRAMYDVDSLVAKLRADVKKAHRGPQPSAVLHASVPKSRGARLRAVGDE